jgi:hypothetical protein
MSQDILTCSLKLGDPIKLWSFNPSGDHEFHCCYADYLKDFSILVHTKLLLRCADR